MERTGTERKGSVTLFYGTEQALANCRAFVVASYPGPNGPGYEASFCISVV